MQNNVQFGVFANDTWVGTIFDDTANTFVLRKEIIRTLLGNEYNYIGVPKIGRKADSNSFITSTGKPRTAQILTFKQNIREQLNTYSCNEVDGMSEDEINYMIQKAEESYLYEMMYM